MSTTCTAFTAAAADEAPPRRSLRDALTTLKRASSSTMRSRATDSTRPCVVYLGAAIPEKQKKGFKLKALLCPFHNQSLKLGAFKPGSSSHLRTPPRYERAEHVRGSSVHPTLHEHPVLRRERRVAGGGGGGSVDDECRLPEADARHERIRAKVRRAVGAGGASSERNKGSS